MRNVAREAELMDRLMMLTGRPWGLPEAAVAEPLEPQETYVGALDVLPEEWDGG